MTSFGRTTDVDLRWTTKPHWHFRRAHYRLVSVYQLKLGRLALTIYRHAA